MGEEEEDTIPSVYIQNMEALSDAAKIASRSIEAYPGVVSAVKQIADCMKQYQGISQTFMENAGRISETIRPIFEYQQQIMESVAAVDRKPYLILRTGLMSDSGWLYPRILCSDGYRCR